MHIAIRTLNTLLLAAILATLLLIWRRMPPTMADLKGVKGEARKAILLRRPYFEIDGSVSTYLSTPLEVTVTNDPLSVTIER